MQTIALPLSSGQDFGKIEYDPCHDRYLGLIGYGTDSLVLAAFTIGTSDFASITTIYPSPGFIMGEQAMLDPDARLYMIKMPDSFLGIDVDDGTVVYDTTIESITGYTQFSHVAYDCSKGQLFGTMVGPCPEGGTGKHLAQLNPSTGAVSIITAHCITSGLMKPALGGSAIDTATAVFYWSGSMARLPAPMKILGHWLTTKALPPARSSSWSTSQPVGAISQLESRVAHRSRWNWMCASRMMRFLWAESCRARNSWSRIPSAVF